MVVIFSITLIFIIMLILLVAKFNESKLVIYLGWSFNAHLFSLIFIITVAGLLLYFFPTYWIWIISGVILAIGYLLWWIMSPTFQYITLSNITCLDWSKRNYSPALIEVAYQKRQAIFEKYGDTIVKRLIETKELTPFIVRHFLSNDESFRTELLIKKSFEINKSESQNQLINLIEPFQEKYSEGNLQLTIRRWLDIITLILTGKEAHLIGDEIGYTSSDFRYGTQCEKKILISVALDSYAKIFNEIKLSQACYNNLLEVAYANDHEVLVKLLVSAGITINQSSDLQQKLFNDFFESITNRNFEQSKFLLSAGFDINLVNTDGDAILHKLCSIDYYKTNPSIVGIKSGVDLWDCAINDDELNHEEKSILNTIKFLVEDGANLNILDRHNLSLLAFACSSLLNYNLIRSLIHCGADVNSSSSKDIPLEIVLNNVIKEANVIWLDLAIHLLKNGAITKFLSPYLLKQLVDSEGDYVFSYYSKEYEYEQVNLFAKTIELMTQNGYDINQEIVDMYGKDTGFLNWIIDSNNSTCGLVELAVKKGVNLNKVNCFEDTPLCAAIKREKFDIAGLLIKEGANVNLPSGGNLKKYPLHLACDGQISSSIVEELIKYGANVNAQTMLETIEDETSYFHYIYCSLVHPDFYLSGVCMFLSGYTPLHYLCCRNKLSLIYRLVSSGANVNIAASNGRTPLILACWYTNNPLIQYLIKNGAEVNVMECAPKESKSSEKPSYPIEIYLKQCHETKEYMLDTVKLLIDYGAKFNNEQDFDDTIQLLEVDEFSAAKIIKDYLVMNQNLLIV